jgi:hypothetical protein
MNAPSKSTELKEARMRCETPAGWLESRDAASDQRTKTAGLTLREPGGGAAPRPFIHLRFYPDGNTLFKDAADYLARQSEPAIAPIAGEKTVASAASAGGLKGRRLLRDTFAPASPTDMSAAEIPVKEELVVLERAGGFYVLALTARKGDFPRLQPAFRRLVESFKPL